MNTPETSTTEAAILAKRWARVRLSDAELKRLTLWSGDKLKADIDKAQGAGLDEHAALSLATDALRDDLGITMADARGLAVLAGKGWS